MIKMVLKYFSIMSLAMVPLFSCTEKIDMEFTTDFERLVVDAQILDGDTLHYVKLSKINLNIEEGIVSPVSDAKVVVNDIDFIESDTMPGFYIAPNNFKGEYGTTYTLNITETFVTGTDGTDVYSASATMGRLLVFDSVAADYINMPSFGLFGYMLKCWAAEPLETNYYLFKAWKNGVLLTDTLYEYQQTDDLLFNGSYLEGVECMFLQDEKPDEYVESGDTLVLEINNIDKAFYDYLNSAQKEYFGSMPLFGGPPSNVISNVSNGAVGVFRVYSVSRGTMILEEAVRY